MNEKNLWFKAKRFGYGWYPSSWQGWGVLLMYLFSMITEAFFVANHAHSGSDFLLSFFPRIFILTTFLIIICEAKGEPARWRWGKVDETKDKS
jgi:hypothetical protein